MKPVNVIPVVLIVYNRPDFTKKALQAIALSKPAQVLVISDGPKADRLGDEDLVMEVRELCDQSNWPFPISVNAAESNMGLRRRIISGLDWVFTLCDAAIILEDDCAPHPGFFTFVDTVLRHHASSDQLGIVSGNNFCGPVWKSDYSYGFSATPRIWGWGTWAHVWRAFSGQESIQFSWTPEERSETVRLVPGKVRRRAIASMMAAGDTLDAWSLAFSVYLLQKGLLSVYPRKNLVENIGFGNRSTHTKFESFIAQIPAEELTLPVSHPPRIKLDEWIEHAESREHTRQLLTYPLLHPFDVMGRLWRYFEIRRNP